MNKALILTNATIVNPSNTENDSTIYCMNGKIVGINECPADFPREHHIIDCKNKMVTPGFIDMHIHGSGGYDAKESTMPEIKRILESCFDVGTTTILLTVTVVNDEKLKRFFDEFQKYATTNDMSTQIVGIHVEGPFINPNKKGAITPSGISTPSKERLHEILEC